MALLLQLTSIGGYTYLRRRKKRTGWHSIGISFRDIFTSRQETKTRDALETSETRLLLLVFGIAWLVVPSAWVDDDCGLDLIVKCGASFKMSKDSVATATLARFWLTTYISILADWLVGWLAALLRMKIIRPATERHPLLYTFSARD